jgi:muconate cycloisomerase
VHVALGYIAHGQRTEDVIKSIELRAVDMFNFSSGIADFLRMSHIADAAGKPYWHGSEIDLGIMEAGYVHAAAATAGATLPSDIFGSMIRESDLLSTPLQFTGTSVVVPDGPGLGVDLDEALLARYEIDRSVITSGASR